MLNWQPVNLYFLVEHIVYGKIFQRKKWKHLFHINTQEIWLIEANNTGSSFSNENTEYMLSHLFVFVSGDVIRTLNTHLQSLQQNNKTKILAQEISINFFRFFFFVVASSLSLSWNACSIVSSVWELNFTFSVLHVIRVYNNACSVTKIYQFL